MAQDSDFPPRIVPSLYNASFNFIFPLNFPFDSQLLGQGPFIIIPIDLLNGMSIAQVLKLGKRRPHLIRLCS